MSPYIAANESPTTSSYPSSNGSSDSRGTDFNSPTPILQNSSVDDLYDLVCVGFGPASLAIAIALHDAFNPRLARQNASRMPRVCFLERQETFGWHAGMQLPGAKMQISFLKDLATLRNPRSDFTFLNYLHCQDRLVQFSNLGTFLPSRLEFEDYMKWCAGSFTGVVEYAQEVINISPNCTAKGSTVTDSFAVRSRNVVNGHFQSRHARHVIIAIGGKPRIPASFPQHHPKVIHTSGYRYRVPQELQDPAGNYHIAVVGGGQSAAETFHDLHSKYPNSHTSLIIRDTALRPSDDSPFVNEIFDPSRVGPFFNQPPSQRCHAIESDKATNYGVVRLELLEAIYSELYYQRIKNTHEQDWPHRILHSRTVQGIEPIHSGKALRLQLRNPEEPTRPAENLDVDAVIVATGYTRDAHNDLLDKIGPLCSDDMHLNGHTNTNWQVQRDYRLILDPCKVSKDAGIWLQGCNEGTHGLSDTLLSILATRGGEIVQSIFGDLLEGHANGHSKAPNIY